MRPAFEMILIIVGFFAIAAAGPIFINLCLPFHAQGLATFVWLASLVGAWCYFY